MSSPVQAIVPFCRFNLSKPLHVRSPLRICFQSAVCSLQLLSRVCCRTRGKYHSLFLATIVCMFSLHPVLTELQKWLQSRHGQPNTVTAPFELPYHLVCSLSPPRASPLVSERFPLVCDVQCQLAVRRLAVCL